MRSSTMAGGASDTFGRSKADFYITPPEVTQAFFKRFFSWDAAVWECACGQGHIAREIEATNRRVLATDLHDRGYGLGGVDFLALDKPLGTSIFTNPPFTLADQFVRKARSFGIPFAFVLKGTYWHGRAHADLMRETAPTHVLPLTWRPAMDPERGNSPTMEFCITVWGPSKANHPPYYEPLDRLATK